jgi:hypothetical protein
MNAAQKNQDEDSIRAVRRDEATTANSIAETLLSSRRLSRDYM